jgi:pimeloyl-ACP methyl ester carboxylesterase
VHRGGVTNTVVRARTVRAWASPYVAEAGAGQDVLFVHGNPDSHDIWSEFVHRLKSRARCFAFDLPNWGRSVAHEKFDCSLESQAGFVKGVADGLGLDRSAWWSGIGGVFGLSFAALHPERIRTLTIFSSAYFPDYIWHRLGPNLAPAADRIAMLITCEVVRRRVVERAADAPGLRRAGLRFVHLEDPARVPLHRAMTFAEVCPAGTPARRPGDPAGDLGRQGPSSPAAPTATRHGHHLAECSHWPMMENPDASAGDRRLISRRRRPDLLGDVSGDHGAPMFLRATSRPAAPPGIWRAARIVKGTPSRPLPAQPFLSLLAHRSPSAPTPWTTSAPRHHHRELMGGVTATPAA